jgi:hypothetical protein
MVKLGSLEGLNFTELPNPISLHPNYMIPKNAITLLS